MIATIFKSEYLQLKRSPLLLIGLLAYLLLGIYAIYYGKQTIEIQQVKIGKATDSTIRAQTAYVKNFMADTTTTSGRYNYEKATVPSLVRFNYPFLAANKPQALASLCIGQRDLFPLYYYLNAQSFYVQTLKGDIYNPFKLKSGNFDLAFVIIYLLPLLLGALCFDTLAAEMRWGTDRLLTIASGNLRKVVFYRIVFRTMVVIGLTLLLCLIGFVFNSKTLPIYYLGWLSVSVIYTVFWAGINIWINSFRKDGSLNAVALLTAWVMIVVILPSAIDLLIGKNYVTRQASIATLMRSRNMPETDSAMHAALLEFYKSFPQYQPKDTVRSGYYYFQGYSAFLFNGDKKADLLVLKRQEELLNHQQQVDRFNIINPAYNASELLSMLSHTTLAYEWAFKNKARDFHRQVYWFSNKPLFENRLMTPMNYASDPHFTQPPNTLNPVKWCINFLMLFVGANVFWLIAWFKLK